MTDEKLHRIHPAILGHARQLRRPQTAAEGILWSRLRAGQLAGLKFRRQHPIGNFIVDFYCASCRLVIELDGDTHVDQIEYDAERTKWLNDQGYRLLRIANEDIQSNLEGVIVGIFAACMRSLDPHPTLSLRGRWRTVVSSIS